MCSLPFKNNRILISTSQEALKILKCVSTSKGKAITAGEYFSEFSCMIPYCTVFSIELDSWALIGSTIGLKNTLKRHWFGFSSRYSFMKKWDDNLTFYSELTRYSIFTLLFNETSTSPWHFIFSLSCWGFLSDSFAPLLSGENSIHLELVQFHLWLDFRL